MVPFYIQLENKLSLIVIPDSTASADGHLVLTYTYSLFLDTKGKGIPIEKKKSRLHLDYIDDPDYLGFITFEQPGKLFTYTANGPNILRGGQSEEVISQISHYRDTPSLWSIE